MKLINLTAIFFFLLMIAALKPAHAQSPDDITNKLKSYTFKHPVEKVYLHFDKPYYAVGDTIYFKGYITLGERHNLSTLSGVLHVDLVNTANKIDKSIKLQIVNGVTWGDFALPDSLPAGNYRVRAYTQIMRNDGTDAFFEKIIPVVSIRAEKSTENSTGKPEIQFFPEGGELIAGIPSRVAFKAIGTNGYGLGVKGYITSETTDSVASISSTHLGMGYFMLRPEENKTYTAHLVFADGAKSDVILPQIGKTGVRLSVNNDSLQKATIRIEANKDYFDANKGKAFSVLIWSGGFGTTVNGKLDSAVISMNIIKRRLFTGVTRITLFSEQMEPLSERLIFIQNYDQLSLGLSTENEHYKKRDKITIKLNAKTRVDSAAIGHFSIAVTDGSKVQINENNETTILTQLLLNSDLKGFVEQPNYYFTDINEQKLKDLDLVMLTHGYRRFEWKQVLDKESPPTKYPIEYGLSIDGRIESVLGKPLPNARMTLFSSETKGFILDTANEQGQFHFKNLFFNDTTKFILQGANANGSTNTKIIYTREESQIPPISKLRYSYNSIDTNRLAYIKNAAKQQELSGLKLPKTRALKEVVVATYRTSSIYGPGHADQVLHAADIENLGGLLADRLNSRLHGVTILNGVPYYFGHRMSIFLDNNQIANLNQINPQDIETVEVLRFTTASIYGVAGGNGVIVLTSKIGKSRTAKDIPSEGVLPIKVVGFYKAREFYSPKYNASSTQVVRPDLRSTIYWNPAVITDKDGNANFEFYSADAPGTYRVVVEGIDNKGDLGRKVFFIKVD